MNSALRNTTVLSLILGAGALGGSAVGTPPPPDQYADMPASIRLTGVVRDMRENTVRAGHPDFEMNPQAGFAHCQNIVQDELDDDGKPVYRSTGFVTTRNWKDSSGRNIMQPRDYISTRPGDQNGTLGGIAAGQATSTQRLNEWFRDYPGVNMSRQLTLTFYRQSGTNVYTFNDATDPEYSGRGGFFPINNELLNNPSGRDNNYHFTFELSARFVCRKGIGQVLTFAGGDDIWVFIDGKKVIDIGGVHDTVSQTIELDRLTWLDNNEDYEMKVFFAERHRPASTLRIDTNVDLRTAEIPSTSAIYD